MTPVVRQVKVFEGELVEIQWTCKDDTLYYERHFIPPKAVREARLAEKKSQDLIDEQGSER